MEASETVMDRTQLKELYAMWETLPALETPNFIDYSQQHQAKISFKAGRESMLTDIPVAIAQSRKNGIREVVEWVENTDIIRMLSPLQRESWQSLKKKWGVKDG